MTLYDYMRKHDLSDDEMADRVGRNLIGPFGIKKLKYAERGASLEVALRIEKVTAGDVPASSLVARRERAAAG